MFNNGAMLSYRQIHAYYQSRRHGRPSAARGAKILVFGFAIIIFIGTLLLKLPWATEEPHNFSWLDALFTATSATTVTGLAILPTATTFTLFGEFVILGLIQIGGVGFIVLSVVLFHLIGRRVTIFERNLVRQDLGVEMGAGIVKLTLYVLLFVLLVELFGAIILFSQWFFVLDSWQQALYYALFHSISAFCNAGFDLFNGVDDPRLITTRHNPIIMLTFCLLITLGTLGITIAYDLLMWPRQRYLSLHSRIVLPLTITLTVVGTIIMLIDETFRQGATLANLPYSDQFLLSFFTIVSSRTAGITFLPMEELGEPSQLIIFIWMFIGGAPASMGGGVGLSTVAVLWLTLRAIVRGYDDIRVFQRTLPLETLTKAVAIVTVSVVLVVVMTLLLQLIDQGDLFPVAFEVVSAFSNTGYSLNLTSELTVLGRLLIIFTMFWGRLGPLTLVVALTQRQHQSLIKYPEERIILG